MTVRNRVLVGLIAAAAAALLTPADLDAQRPAGSSSTTTGAKAIPRTAEGTPDMQGDWTNATYTPLERPEALKGKEFFTPEEAAAYQEEAAARPRRPTSRHALRRRDLDERETGQGPRLSENVDDRQAE